MQAGKGGAVALGSYPVEVWGKAYPPLVCWALDALPPGPWTAETLLPFLLPYHAPSPVVEPGTSYVAADPLLVYSATASFTHPSGHGPLTIHAVALVWLLEEPALSSQPFPVGPVTTPGPGYVVDIPLYRTIIAPRAED